MAVLTLTEYERQQLLNELEVVLDDVQSEIRLLAEEPRTEADDEAIKRLNSRAERLSSWIKQLTLCQ